MANVIFLDVDGPMIPVRAAYLPNQTYIHSMFDPIASSFLNKLLEDSRAKLVISSTWALKGRDMIVDLLTKNGIDPNVLHVDWTTPRTPNFRDRSGEIRGWLDAHPDTTHWVAIDDEALDYDRVPNLVRCCTYDGFLFRNYFECGLLLNCLSEGILKHVPETLAFLAQKTPIINKQCLKS